MREANNKRKIRKEKNTTQYKFMVTLVNARYAFHYYFSKCYYLVSFTFREQLLFGVQLDFIQKLNKEANKLKKNKNTRTHCTYIRRIHEPDVHYNQTQLSKRHKSTFVNIIKP